MSRLAECGSVHLMGARLDALAMDEAVGHIVDCAQAGIGGWVLTPNVDILRRIVHDPEFAALAAKADLSLPDGMPLVWASRLEGRPLPQRVAMSELVFPLSVALARAGMSIYLLGDEPDVARHAAAVLLDYAPGLRVAGSHSPPQGFDCDTESVSSTVTLLREAAPDVVVVALGCPKQENLITSLRQSLPCSWFLAAGATLSIVAGVTPAAPDWMRRSGLEWAHRLRLEPRRLFGRYVVRDLPFAIRLLLSSARARVSWR